MISLIVCTRNRADRLGKCLNAVFQADDVHDVEIIVVDNGSTDNTRNVLDNFSRGVSPSIRRVFEPTPGLARARNRAIAHATGELLAFTDDDCYLRHDYFKSIVKTFQDGRIDFCGGRVLLYDPKDSPITILERNVSETINPYSYIPAGFIHGANMIIRRDPAITCAGFDERLGAGTDLRSGEDIDILARLSWAGYTGTFDPRIVVFHHHGRQRPEEVSALRAGYALGRGAYFFKRIVSAQSRATYLKHWYWHARSSNYLTTARELLGAWLLLRQSQMSIRKVRNHPATCLRI